ncbi:RNA polymerase sigma factor [Streptomyces sp. ACA25]|uniref:RNA polymerase sigma factor n=1 Tax=Streptomyces sp. ACA25 TaxID=3022596 RepID=UPI003FA78E2E
MTRRPVRSAALPPAPSGSGLGTDVLEERGGGPAEVWFFEDEKTLAAGYRQWGGLVHSLAYRALGDEREAEDITQQVFLAAWRGRQGYRPERGPFAGWLVGITRRKIADALAARARRRELIRAAGVRQEPSSAGTEHAEAVLNRVLVAQELSKLPENQQRVLRLVFFDDLTQAQAAERTGMPLGTVKSHARRGLHQLRRGLEAVAADR